MFRSRPALRAPTWAAPWTRSRKLSLDFTYRRISAWSMAAPIRNSNARFTIWYLYSFWLFCWFSSYCCLTFAAPLAILASALLSTSGVFIALLITRTTFNISSFMGMIMVVGIVAKNGILLLDADQKFRILGLSSEDAMLQASRRRLRPIVMTALATMAGMLPLAFALGAGSQMLQPLAIAVIGGIVISMMLSLIITPAVHFYLSREKAERTELSPVR